jgi:hypothetical protein
MAAIAEFSQDRLNLIAIKFNPCPFRSSGGAMGDSGYNGRNQRSAAKT